MRCVLGMAGFGSMGGAILRGAIGAGVLAPNEVIVAEPDGARRDEAADLGCAVAVNAGELRDAEQIMLAVKPQVFGAVAKSLGPLERDTITISIMAGLSSAVIRGALGSRSRIIRAMPNTPCRLRAGISAIAMGEGAQAGDDALARRILGSIGEVVEVEESQLHAVTAVSGSGPAYVFLLAESMTQAGVQMGLHAATARRLAYHTVLGAGRLLTEHDDVDAEALRTAVTSPGGTTAAALEEMFERELPQIIVDALHAARDRGVELDVGEATKERREGT